MAAGKFDPKSTGYVEVKDRIKVFMEKYPEGSLQSEIVELSDTLVVMRGYAYRTPDDPRPGVGHSQMPIPGKTPYTKDSEVENAETSAWGRAIAALGFEVHNSIACAEEVAMKAGDPTLTVARGASSSAKPAGSSSRGSTTPPSAWRRPGPSSSWSGPSRWPGPSPPGCAR